MPDQNADSRSLLVAVVAIILAVVGWNNFYAAPCPTGVSTEIDWAAFTVQQSTTKDGIIVSAQLTDVSAECLPSKTEDLYEIAATAKVTSIIENQAVFESVRQPVDMPVTFEAVSKNGVVLGTGRGNFRAGSYSGTASGKVYGLSRDAMRRVAKVRVRWVYGE